MRSLRLDTKVPPHVAQGIQRITANHHEAGPPRRPGPPECIALPGLHAQQLRIQRLAMGFTGWSTV